VVHPSERAAARADRDEVDGREQNGNIPVDLPFGHKRWSAVGDQGQVSVPPCGYTGMAWCEPAITANSTPSRMASMAAIVAARACTILLCGAPMEPGRVVPATAAGTRAPGGRRQSVLRPRDRQGDPAGRINGTGPAAPGCR